jgi:hypothetical protein
MRCGRWERLRAGLGGRPRRGGVLLGGTRGAGEKVCLQVPSAGGGGCGRRLPGQRHRLPRAPDQHVRDRRLRRLRDHLGRGPAQAHRDRAQQVPELRRGDGHVTRRLVVAGGGVLLHLRERRADHGGGQSPRPNIYPQADRRGSWLLATLSRAAREKRGWCRCLGGEFPALAAKRG